MTRARLKLALLAGALSLVACVIAARAAQSSNARKVRYRPLAIVLDSAEPLAAYQVEIRVVSGEAMFIGVEGGEAPMSEPPHYDPMALSGQRIVLAALDVNDSYARGRHRVATLHVREYGDVRYELELVAAADPNARRVDAHAELVPDSLAPKAGTDETDEEIGPSVHDPLAQPSAIQEAP